MILPIHRLVRARMADVLSRLYQIDAADPVVADMAVELPPNRALGDFAVPLAFSLARRLRKAPRAIAQEIASALGDVEGFSRIEATPNGYINFFLDRPALARQWLRGEAAAAATGSAKAIVEHTAINPNKAAHIGHLRNAALGDAFGRLLRFLGRDVEIQNYIDDTGVQVADVAVGFQELEHKSLDEVRQIAATTRFDYYCWDLYARVTEWYEQDRERLKIRARALHAIEHGGNATAELAHFIADHIVRCHLRTMRRMNIGYDLLTWEGDILELQFWAHAFEYLKKTGAVYLQTEGKLAGCWVMKIEDEDRSAGEGEPGAPQDTAGDAADEIAEQKEKVIVRSDGTVTYVGKDMAYQLWKFGLLGKDFHYRVFEDGEKPLWSTTSDPGAAVADPPVFGRAAWVCNVIDTRQSYLQKLLKQALAALGYHEQAAHSIHYSYEMVALSHATARELGYDTSAESDRPFVEVSGRKGLGVKADDLLDRLREKAAAEVAKRNPELDAAEAAQIAEAIGTAAVRYFMVKFSRGKVIVFDIDEALSFEGESGPYLQYATVRANNIFNKLKERHGLDEAAVLAAVTSAPEDAIAASTDEAQDLWGLMLEAARLDEVVDQAVRTLELSVLAKYAFGLAQAFNGFYHKHSIVNEEREDARLWRAAAVAFYRRQLTTALELMGCRVPAKM
ncbi:MAG TPA: arginine--tRNA ligase [Vicinamibacterales bacterium]|nr:arginine--tRNA ligase [Vicinamibacterales bacterium]